MGHTWHTEYDLDVMEVADPSTPIEVVAKWLPILRAEGQENGRTGVLNQYRLDKAEKRLQTV